MQTNLIKQTIKIHATLDMMKFGEACLATTILGKLSQQRQDGKFCDVVLTVDKEDLTAHKCVLAASSSYFENVVTDGDLEYKIQVFDSTPAIVVQVLEYIYTGQIEINSENFAEVVDLAVRFSLFRLQDHCIEYLVSNINDKTCFHIHDLAKQYGLIGLRNVVDGFVLANILKLIESDSVCEVSLSSLELFVGRSVPLLERQRLDVISKWIEHKRNVRKDSLPVLLKAVRWSELTAEDLDDFLDTSNIVSGDEWMHFHVLMSINNADKLPRRCTEKFASLKELFMKFKESESCDEDAAAEAIEDDDATVDYPEGSETVKMEVPPIPLAPAEADVALPSQQVKKSARLALKLRRAQHLDERTPSLVAAGDVAPERGGNTRKGRQISVKKEANKENSTDALNVEVACKKKKPRIKKTLGTTKSRKPRGRSAASERLSCPECTFETRWPERLSRHAEVAHKDRDKTFACVVCDFTCKWNRQFYFHLRSKHFPGPPFHCDSCGHSSPSIQLLLLHRMDHSESRPHRCSTCGVTFKVKCSLDAHLRCHTGEKPFECLTCHRSFTTKGTLEQHRSTHSSNRPYLCHLCGFSTKYQSHFKSHSRLHTGELFKCQHANCDYKTPKRSQLACHQRCHLHVRSHKCLTCDRSFKERSHLVRHERIHLDIRPFRCELCDYASTRRDKLKEHHRKYHDDASADNNKMAYRPRKSRLLSAMIKDEQPEASLLLSRAEKSTSAVKKRSNVPKKSSKRTDTLFVLEEVDEDEVCSPNPNTSAHQKRKCQRKYQWKNTRCRDTLLVREAEMREWLAKSSKEPPVSPIKIDTGVNYPHPDLSEVSPNFHSFSSLNSSSSGISKHPSGGASSGIGTGSQGTGQTNLMISPSGKTAVTGDLSSPGIGSSSSLNSGLSPSGSGKSNGGLQKGGGASNGAPKVRIAPTSSKSMPPELLAARKRLIQDRIKRFVTSKSSPRPTNKIILLDEVAPPPDPCGSPHPRTLPPPSPPPISVVTFKADEPPRSTSDRRPSTSALL